MAPQTKQPSQASASDSPHSTFKGTRGRLHHRCGLCHKTGTKLSKCAGCQTIRYFVGTIRWSIDQNTTNAFETGVGHFWGIFSTRSYMRARFDLADALRRLGTLDGVTEALDHLRDMVRLCRSDNLGLRDLVPPVMLQLDQDQECYDFIKWWRTEAQRNDYDFGDMDLPYLNVKDANVLEDVRYLIGNLGHVQHISTVMLLKLKLLVDIINIKVTRALLAGRLPPELWKRTELQVFVALSVFAQKTLQDHIKLLARALQDSNEHFLHLIEDADDHLSEIPEHYSNGSFEEILLLLQHSYPAWWQHEGVLELVRSAKSIAGKDSEDEIADLMKTACFKNNPGSDRSKEELLNDVSLNRLWGYFDDAVEDAMSLNADRPSDVKRETLRAMMAANLEGEDDWTSDDQSE
ncbi:hypothetical protein H2200_009831 [Cladophialophora chaetospira]|uniref:Uncharacterized protein n=1 Tax=Cladophialophora chaetospira TaxID=386627 RepID=A0AA38X3A3_9EURO|nr:hypothetical protein H2200_009831 [Cladophialophora chaetospira]